MREKAKQIANYFLTQVIIPNVLWMQLLTLLAAIAGGVKFLLFWYAALNGKGVSSGTIVFIGICALVCLLDIILLLFYFIYGTHLRRQLRSLLEKQQETQVAENRIVPPYPPLPAFDYSILRIEFELYFVDRETIIHRQSITYQAENDSLEYIHHNMQWSGDGYGGSTLGRGNGRTLFRISR